MDANDPPVADEPELPPKAPLSRSNSISAEEALADYERHLARMPPPYDDATRYIRERDLERMRARFRNPPTRHEAETEPAFRASRLKRYEALFKLKAIALLERGSVTVETNGTHPLTATLRRFKDGSAVLETWVGGSGGMRPMQPEDFDVDRIARTLEFALLNARRRPIAGQEI